MKWVAPLARPNGLADGSLTHAGRALADHDRREIDARLSPVARVDEERTREGQVCLHLVGGGELHRLLLQRDAHEAVVARQTTIVEQLELAAVVSNDADAAAHGLLEVSALHGFHVHETPQSPHGPDAIVWLAVRRAEK